MSNLPSPLKLAKYQIPDGATVYRINAPFMAKAVSNERVTEETSPDDIRHIIIDLSGSGVSYLEGQSLGILAPGMDDGGKPHKLRLYSISSARTGDDGYKSTVSLTVKRVVYTDDNGVEVRGVASNFLCDLEPGDPVPVTGPTGRHFILPEDGGTHLILAAVGTGIAPFRAFLEYIYRERGGWEGNVRLFMGAKTQAELVYMNRGNAELARFFAAGSFKAFPALSREKDKPKTYIQDRFAEQKAEMWPLITGGNFALYICGLKGIETGLETVLTQWASEDGKDWAAMKKEFIAQGRWHVEVY